MVESMIQITNRDKKLITQNIIELRFKIEIYDENNNAVTDAKLVQQKLYLKTDIPLQEGDILRCDIK